MSLHVESHGTGTPVTVFAGGLGASIAETRAFASGVGGTRVFYDARGHGRSGSDGDWSYAALAGDLRAVADAVGATRAVGVSMGAAAVLGVLVSDAARFERAVLVLPAILDVPRGPVPRDGLAGFDGLVRALEETAPIASRSVLARATAPCLVVGQEGDPVHPAHIARELAAALPGARLHVSGEPGGLLTHRAEWRALIAPFLNP